MSIFRSTTGSDLIRVPRTLADERKKMDGSRRTTGGSGRKVDGSEREPEKHGCAAIVWAPLGQRDSPMSRRLSVWPDRRITMSPLRLSMWRHAVGACNSYPLSRSTLFQSLHTTGWPLTISPTPNRHSPNIA